MKKSDSIAEISKALAPAQQNVSNVVKTAENNFLNSKYPTLAEVVNEIMPIFSSKGLSILQTTDIKEDGSLL